MERKVVRRIRTNKKRQGFYLEMSEKDHKALMRWREKRKALAVKEVAPKVEKETSTHDLVKSLGFLVED